MSGKFVVLSLVLLLAGSAVFGWALAVQGKETQLQYERQEKNKAGFDVLDKLVTGKIDLQSFADIPSDEIRQQKPEQYKRRKEGRELAVTISIVSMLTGGTALGWWLVLWTARLVIRGASHLTKSTTDCSKPQKQTKTKKTLEPKVKKVKKLLAQHLKPPRKTSPQTNAPIGDSLDHNSSVENTKKIAVLLSDKRTVERRESLRADRSNPINNTLTQLAEQMTAIREYASQQQQRVEKLQNGYDWNIIRNFCLRIIRCIDNLQNRINNLSKQDVDTADLEQVRDELLFALESSGLEQFEPQTDSEYRGQEKLAEVVKEKQSCDDPNLKGKIAKVIRPGYQYVINEESTKVVRTAVVKLFG